VQRSLLFQGVIANATTKYIGVPLGSSGRFSLDIQWKDATSSATITLESTQSPHTIAPVEEAGDAWEWKTETGVSITGPAASAAGSTKLHVSNMGPCRLRLKIVTAAQSTFEIYGSTTAE